MIQDEASRKTGSVYENGEFTKDITEIPNSAYSGHLANHTFIYTPIDTRIEYIDVICKKDGTYSLYVIEVNNGRIERSLSKKNITTTTKRVDRYKINGDLMLVETVETEELKKQPLPQNLLYILLGVGLGLIAIFIWVFLIKRKKKSSKTRKKKAQKKMQKPKNKLKKDLDNEEEK